MPGLGDEEPAQDVQREAGAAEDHQAGKAGSDEDRIDVEVVAETRGHATEHAIGRAPAEPPDIGRAGAERRGCRATVGRRVRTRVGTRVGRGGTCLGRGGTRPGGLGARAGGRLVGDRLVDGLFGRHGSIVGARDSRRHRDHPGGGP